MPLSTAKTRRLARRRRRECCRGGRRGVRPGGEDVEVREVVRVQRRRREAIRIVERLGLLACCSQSASVPRTHGVLSIVGAASVETAVGGDREGTQGHRRHDVVVGLEEPALHDVTGEFLARIVVPTVGEPAGTTFHFTSSWRPSPGNTSAPCMLRRRLWRCSRTTSISSGACEKRRSASAGATASCCPPLV